MRGYGYTQSRGGFANLPMALTLASTLGGGAFFGGGRGAGMMGADMQGTLGSVASMLSEKIPMTGESISWGLAGTIGAVLALFFALTSDERRYGTALIALVALAFFGMMLAGGKGADTAEAVVEKGFEQVPSLPDEILSAGPTVEEALARREPDCPEGHFAKAGACHSCLAEAGPPALEFSAAGLDAAWRYASDETVVPLSFLGRLGAEPEPIGEIPLARMIGDRSDVCRADAALILGSASADGPAERNRARARRRADSLAREVERLCPGLPVYALSLGQSSAPSDKPADRALTILAVEKTTPGETIDAEAIMAALARSELMRGEGTEAPLLSRLRHFEDDWRWVRGGSGAAVLDPAAARQGGLAWREGAPPSCRGTS